MEDVETDTDTPDRVESAVLFMERMLDFGLGVVRSLSIASSVLLAVPLLLELVELVMLEVLMRPNARLFMIGIGSFMLLLLGIFTINFIMPCSGGGVIPPPPTFVEDDEETNPRGKGKLLAF